jgi:hypothetical protein
MNWSSRQLHPEGGKKLDRTGLSNTTNTVDDFVLEGKVLEAAMKTMDHYDCHFTIPA